MRRKLAGITFGLLLALITIVTIEAIANRLFGAQLSGDASATVASTQQPPAMLVSVLIGWFLAALAGGAAAAYISRLRAGAWIVGLAVLFGVALRFATEAQPGCVFVAGPLAPLAGAAFAQFAARKKDVLAREPGDPED